MGLRVIWYWYDCLSLHPLGFFFRCIFYDILFSNREIYNLFFGALIVHLREIFGDIGSVYELFLGTSVLAKHFFKVTHPP